MFNDTLLPVNTVELRTAMKMVLWIWWFHYWSRIFLILTIKYFQMGFISRTSLAIMEVLIINWSSAAKIHAVLQTKMKQLSRDFKGLWTYYEYVLLNKFQFKLNFTLFVVVLNTYPSSLLLHCSVVVVNNIPQAYIYIAPWL